MQLESLQQVACRSAGDPLPQCHMHADATPNLLNPTALRQSHADAGQALCSNLAQSEIAATLRYNQGTAWRPAFAAVLFAGASVKAAAAPAVYSLLRDALAAA